MSGACSKHGEDKIHVNG